MLPRSILLDAGVIISYLTGDSLFEHGAEVIVHVVAGLTVAYVSSEIYNDIASMLRSNNVPLDGGHRVHQRRVEDPS